MFKGGRREIFTVQHSNKKYTQQLLLPFFYRVTSQTSQCLSQSVSSSAFIHIQSVNKTFSHLLIHFFSLLFLHAHISFSFFSTRKHAHVRAFNQNVYPSCCFMYSSLSLLLALCIGTKSFLLYCSKNV